MNKILANKKKNLFYRFIAYSFSICCYMHYFTRKKYRFRGKRRREN